MGVDEERKSSPEREEIAGSEQSEAQDPRDSFADGREKLPQRNSRFLMAYLLVD